MALTLPELQERLAARDLDELLELLEIDSETLVALAVDLIEERYVELVDYLAEEDLYDDNRS